MDLRKALASDSPEAFRNSLMDTLKRRLFWMPSVESYRRVHGVYGYGPHGCSMEWNVLDLWDRHFVIKEQLWEISCPYKAERRADYYCNVLMVLDGKTGTRYRADQLLRDLIKHERKSSSITAEKAEQLEELFKNLYELSPEELVAKMKDCGVTAPETKNPLSDPWRLKLRFQTLMGESGFQPGKYMRAEAARPGRNFEIYRFLFDFMDYKLPCAGAYVGSAFREEISSSPAALTVHEFTVAEIQYFVNPEDKTHRKFSAVADVEIFVFPRERQMSGRSSIKSRIGVAVSEGVIDNQTLGYFIGRVFLFLTCLGIDKDCLRFRQRVQEEMARHATDCWVAEVECSNGWIECVDIADWSSYDLSEHTAASEVEALNMKAALVSEGEAAFPVCTSGRTVTIEDNMEAFCEKRVFRPSVIEPSFGIERIIHCVFEHCFYRRPNKAGHEQVNVFRFPPVVAPIKCAVFQLGKKLEPEHKSVVEHISRSLTAAGVFHSNYIAGNTIGKMYARIDELGVPYSITVYSQVDVAIRDRDSTDQVRVNVEEAALIVKKLIDGHKSWASIRLGYPQYRSVSAEENE